MTECIRLDRHDHDDPRLRPWFHAWLRGERRKAPPLHSWKSQRSLSYPSGSSAGLNGRRDGQAWAEGQPRLPGAAA